MGWETDQQPGTVTVILACLGAAVILPALWIRGKLKKKLSLNEELWRSVFRR